MSFIIKCFFTFNRYIARPIGSYYGISCDFKLKLKLNNNSNSECEVNVNKNFEKILEKYFESCKNPPESILAVSFIEYGID